MDIPARGPEPSYLVDAWRDPDFRAALRRLVRMDTEDVPALVKAAESDDLGTARLLLSRSSGATPTDFEVGVTVAVALFLRKLVVDGGATLDSVIAQLAALAAASEDASDLADILPRSMPTLRLAVESTASLGREADRAAEQRTVFPTFEDIDLRLDLRVSTLGNRIQFTPVIVARARFDEPVAGSGQNVITFQLPDDAMSRLEDQLSQIKQLAERVHPMLPEPTE